MLRNILIAGHMILFAASAILMISGASPSTAAVSNNFFGYYTIGMLGSLFSLVNLYVLLGDRATVIKVILFAANQFILLMSGIVLFCALFARKVGWFSDSNITIYASGYVFVLCCLYNQYHSLSKKSNVKEQVNPINEPMPVNDDTIIF